MPLKSSDSTVLWDLAFAGRNLKICGTNVQRNALIYSLCSVQSREASDIDRYPWLQLSIIS